MIFLGSFGDFWPFLGDIGPFFRPYLGGKLGDGYQLQIYINHAFLRPWGGDSEKIYVEDFPSQSHFYAGKLLKSAPLQTIFGSFGHPI
jgi:hypothetical protein